MSDWCEYGRRHFVLCRNVSATFDIARAAAGDDELEALARAREGPAGRFLFAALVAQRHA
jgi:hypothetical protein